MTQEARMQAAGGGEVLGGAGRGSGPGGGAETRSERPVEPARPARTSSYTDVLLVPAVVALTFVALLAWRFGPRRARPAGVGEERGDD